MGEFHIDMKILKLEILYHHEVLKMLIRFPKISPIGNELDLNEGGGGRIVLLEPLYPR